MGQPRPLFFKHRINFTTNTYVKKCPSSIQYPDSNPQPLEYESPPITTRPGLPFLCVCLFKPMTEKEMSINKFTSALFWTWVIWCWNQPLCPNSMDCRNLSLANVWWFISLFIPKDVSVTWQNFILFRELPHSFICCHRLSHILDKHL